MTGSVSRSTPAGWKGRVLARLSPGTREVVRLVVREARALVRRARWAFVVARCWGKKPGSHATFLGRRVRINDGPNFCVIVKDVVLERIYDFEPPTDAPVVIDAGSNIGLTILRVKHLFPKARVVGFEPDPVIWPYLEENVRHVDGVTVHNAALAAKEGALTFWSDARCGSCLAESSPGPGWTRHEVRTVRLRDFLEEEVDFLKMNIEGAEWSVLADSEDRLRRVRELVIEYHHLPGLERTLHSILALLDRQGFEYMINDFDGDTNPEVRVPFRLSARSRYFLLVYARRKDTL